MNDDQISSLWLRANAYVDGDVDEVERARIEADPAVMVEVAHIVRLRAELIDHAPTPAVRESAIAAALAEFDARATSVPPAQPVVPLRPRRAEWQGRWLGVAAAVVAIAFVGVVVSRAGGGDSADTAAEDAATSSATGNASATYSTESARADQAIEASAEGSVVDAPGEFAIAATDEASAPPVTQQAGLATDAPAAETTAAESVTTAAATTNDWKFLPDTPIATPDQLAAAGEYYLALERAGNLGPTPEAACAVLDAAGDALDVLGAARYELPDGEREVLIALDSERATTSAIDRTTCEIVATVATP